MRKGFIKRLCDCIRYGLARDYARVVSHHKVYHHAHHCVYFLYYLFALFEHKGLEAFIAGGLLVFSLVTALAGE